MNFTRGHGLLENFLAKKRAKIANNFIPQKLRDGRVLDIGCGQFPYFIINSDFKKKYGVDLSVNRDIIDGVNIQTLNVEKGIPFEDNFFDVIVMLAIIEHIDQGNVVNVLKDIKRVLKPGGRFILTTPCPRSDKLLKFMSLMGLVSSTEIDDHKAAYNLNSLSHYLQYAGFKKNKIKSGYFEFFLNSWMYVDNY